MNINDERQFIPYLVLEEYYKKRYLTDIKNMDLFLNYISSYFAVKKDKISFETKYKDIDNKVINYISFIVPRESEHRDEYYRIDFDGNGEIATYNSQFGIRCEISHDSKINSFKRSKKTKYFLKNFIIPYLKQSFDHVVLPWAGGNCLTTNYSQFKVDIKCNKLQNLSFSIYNPSTDPSSLDSLYYKSIDANGETDKINHFKSKKYTEEEIGKILTSLEVDISLLPKEEQEGIKQLYIASSGKLDIEKEEKLNEFRKLHVDRMMMAYQKFKEFAEQLNDTKTDLIFDKIKIDNLRNIIFKNNGNPTTKGYIEFDDFFKNNMILRMLDLSQLDLTNVNITYMDFSGTNVHINPQTIYNKDMTGVNALGVHFSPFRDSFDDAILDGALINDYEAMIDYNKLRSYNDNTVIRKEVVSKSIK